MRKKQAIGEAEENKSNIFEFDHQTMIKRDES